MCFRERSFGGGGSTYWFGFVWGVVLVCCDALRRFEPTLAVDVTRCDWNEQVGRNGYSSRNIKIFLRGH